MGILKLFTTPLGTKLETNTYVFTRKYISKIFFEINSETSTPCVLWGVVVWGPVEGQRRDLRGVKCAAERWASTGLATNVPYTVIDYIMFWYSITWWKETFKRTFNIRICDSLHKDLEIIFYLVAGSDVFWCTLMGSSVVGPSPSRYTQDDNRYCHFI